MIDGFNRALAFRLIGPTSKVVELLEPLTYSSPGVGGYYVVPAGFCCDLASIPQAIAALAPDWRSTARAGVLHDLCYRSNAGIARRTADALIHEALLLDEVDALRARAVWVAVRLFGARSYRVKPIAWRPRALRHD